MATCNKSGRNISDGKIKILDGSPRDKSSEKSRFGISSASLEKDCLESMKQKVIHGLRMRVSPYFPVDCNGMLMDQRDSNPASARQQKTNSA